MDKENIAFLTAFTAITLMIISLMISAIAIDKANKALFEVKESRLMYQKLKNKFILE